MAIQLKGKVQPKGSNKLKAANKTGLPKAKGKKVKGRGLGEANIDAPDFKKWLDGYEKTSNRTMRRKKNGLQ